MGDPVGAAAGPPGYVRVTCGRGQKNPHGFQEEKMSEGVYKYIDVVGTSASSIEDAVQRAVVQASKSVRQIQWFEMKEIRGRVDQGKVVEIQVSMRLGFRLE
jgi:flavin-binding protein dodecin